MWCGVETLAALVRVPDQVETRVAAGGRLVAAVSDGTHATVIASIRDDGSVVFVGDCAETLMVGLTAATERLARNGLAQALMVARSSSAT